MWQARLPALALVGVLALPPLPASPATATLDGVIRSADRTPLAGARLLAADAERGAVHRSEPTTADGNFTLAELAPGTWALAVETAGGRYVVGTPIELVAGVRRSVQIAIGPAAAAPAATAAASPSAGVWNNPFSAGAIVLGVAIVVGVLVKDATEDETAASPP